MGALTTHGCGKSWKQRGNRTGHCSGCHETFEGLSLFDAHFDRSGPKLACRDPREMEFDRIDNDGHYEPGNVRWATRAEQNQNQRKRKDSRS